MECSINDLKNKEVINIAGGIRLGYVSDVEIDLANGRLTALVVPGNYRIMGLFGKEADVIIKWEDIRKIGDDLIIVEIK